jgi:hypothetical protein
MTVRDLVEDHLNYIDPELQIYIINDSEWGNIAFPLKQDQIVVYNGNLIIGIYKDNLSDLDIREQG